MRLRPQLNRAGRTSTTHDQPVNGLLELADIPGSCVGLEPGNHVRAEQTSRRYLRLNRSRKNEAQTGIIFRSLP